MKVTTTQGEITMGKLDSKVAVITGGAVGIGKSTAIAFLKEGVKVVLVDLFDDSLRTTKEELESYGEVIIKSLPVPTPPAVISFNAVQCSFVF